MTLKEIMSMQAEFDAGHAGNTSWGQPITPTSLHLLEHGVVCLVGEVGEFANIVKKVIRGDVSYEDACPRLTEELTDAFIYLIKLCNQLGVNLESAFIQRLEYNRERFKKYEK